LLARAGELERSVIAAFVAVAVGFFAFVRIADEVTEEAAPGFDAWTIGLFRDPSGCEIGPLWLKEAMRDLTALGSTSVLTLVTLATASFLAISRKAHASLLVVGAVGTGVLLSNGLKYLFARDRPPCAEAAAATFTASFPSGHSMMAAVTYLTLGVLLARTQRAPLVKLYVLVVALLLTALVGVSRVFLGAHWPSDVLGGWALGAAWALLCWLLALWLQSRGGVEEGS
jgi:undecaprenyl-diphosphatase